MQRLLAGLLLCFVTVTAQASAFEALKKLLKSAISSNEAGVATREANTASHAARDLPAPGKDLEHLRPSNTHDLSVTPPLTGAPEPKPDLSSKLSAKNPLDLEAYKSLRSKATSGETSAMLNMSEFTRSGKVTDPGEPYYGYWLFQAARLGNGSRDTNNKIREVCYTERQRRRVDRWFDAACTSFEKKVFFTEPSGDKYLDIIQEKKIIRRTEAQK